MSTLRAAISRQLYQDSQLAAQGEEAEHLEDFLWTRAEAQQIIPREAQYWLHRHRQPAVRDIPHAGRSQRQHLAVEQLWISELGRVVEQRAAGRGDVRVRRVQRPNLQLQILREVQLQIPSASAVQGLLTGIAHARLHAQQLDGRLHQPEHQKSQEINLLIFFSFKFF